MFHRPHGPRKLPVSMVLLIVCVLKVHRVAVLHGGTQSVTLWHRLPLLGCPENTSGLPLHQSKNLCNVKIATHQKGLAIIVSSVHHPEPAVWHSTILAAHLATLKRRPRSLRVPAKWTRGLRSTSVQASDSPHEGAHASPPQDMPPRRLVQCQALMCNSLSVVTCKWITSAFEAPTASLFTQGWLAQHQDHGERTR